MPQFTLLSSLQTFRASPLARLFRYYGTTDSGASIPLGGRPEQSEVVQSWTQGGLVSDIGTLTDTGVVENPIVDTGALQGRLLYDKNGNLIGNTTNNKRQFEYVYDAQNRLVQVNRYNDVTGKEVLISFSYDALGRRTSKKVANVTYDYVYSGNDVIEETQSNINPTSGVKVKKETREYTYGARGTDDVVAVRYSTYDRVKKVDVLVTIGNYYYEKDHLGSVIRITDSNGNIVDEYSYTVFGKPYKKNTLGIYKPVSGSNKSAINNTRLYTGREYDREISLYYLRARYYDANLGRFVSRDPIGMRDNVNLYTYVGNSPVMYSDPFGKEKKILNAIQNAKSIQIDLVARKLQGVGGPFGAHSFIEFTIQDNLGNTNSYSIGGHNDDILSVHFNDAVDVGWMGKKERQSIATPEGMIDKEFATQLVREAVFYDQNPKDYALLSADDGYDTEGNCHNFSTTMLMRASNYSSSVLSTIQDFNPSGANPGLGEYFVPVCTE